MDERASSAVPTVTKAEPYAELVATRRTCHRCAGLTNPADLLEGRFDSAHVGPWSLWQGNLHAALMVVGQDWGDTAYFVRHEGREAAEVLRHDADDLVGHTIDLKAAPDDCHVSVEESLPAAVTQHHRLPGGIQLVVFGQQRAAQCGARAEDLEEVAGHER